MHPARAKVTLEIELDREPVQRSLSNCDGANQAFTGRIQLVSLLQDATTPAPQHDQPLALAQTPPRPQEAT
jgi:hypothetical protein